MTIGTAAVANPMTRHIGVDDFSQVDDDGANRAIFNELRAGLDIHNIEFVETDFRDFLANRTLAGTRDASVFFSTRRTTTGANSLRCSTDPGRRSTAV